MTEPTGLHCPGCGGPPIWVFGGGLQAWCGNDECAVLTWNPQKTAAELMADMKVINLANREAADDRHGGLQVDRAVAAREQTRRNP